MKKALLVTLLATLLSYSNAQTITTVAGGNGPGNAADQLNTPQDVFVDASGNIYVADEVNSRIQKFPMNSDSSTTGVTVAGGNAAGTAADQLNYPTSLYVDSAENIYIADRRNNRIQRFAAGSNSSSNAVTVAAIGINGSIGVFLDQGSIYVSDEGNNSIVKFSSGSDSATAGLTVAGGNSRGNSPYQLNQPNNMYLDSTGNIYVADYYNNRIQKFAAGSNSLTAGTTVAGGNGPGNAANQLNGPVGVYLDKAGNIYVSDEINNRIQKFPPNSDSTTNGVTIVGDTIGGSGRYQLSYPNGIFVDNNGAIYIADGGNNRIQKWSPATTGISDISSSKPLSLYPNPNNGSFILQSGGSIGSEYTVYDMIGRAVAQGTITSDKQNIDLAASPLSLGEGSGVRSAGLRSISAGSYTLAVQGSKTLWFVIED